MDDGTSMLLHERKCKRVWTRKQHLWGSNRAQFLRCGKASAMFVIPIRKYHVAGRIDGSFLYSPFLCFIHHLPHRCRSTIWALHTSLCRYAMSELIGVEVMSIPVYVDTRWEQEIVRRPSIPRWSIEFPNETTYTTVISYSYGWTLAVIPQLYHLKVSQLRPLLSDSVIGVRLMSGHCHFSSDWHLNA